MTDTYQSLFTSAADIFTRLAALSTQPAPTPIPDPTPTPTPAPAPDMAVCTVNISSAQVPLGGGVLRLSVRLDRPVGYTVVANINTQNGTGATMAYEGGQFVAVRTHVTFMPGETEGFVDITLRGGKEGQTFNVIQPNSVMPIGCKSTNGKVTFTAAATALPAAPTVDHLTYPAPKSGVILWQPDLSPAGFKAKDGGAKDAWDTCLPARMRTQPSNGEPGYYTDKDLNPGQTPWRVDENGLYLRTEDLLVPVTVAGKTYNLASSILTSQAMFSAQYGRISAEMKLPPTGRHQWPAFWLMPKDGSWPPELDILEAGIGGEADPTIAQQTQHWGTGSQLGTKAKTGVDLTADFHEHAVEWREDWIVWFVDGKETFRERNMIFKPMYVLLQNTLIPGATQANTDLTTGNETAFRNLKWGA